MAQKALRRIAELQDQLRSGSINRRDFLRYVTMLGMSVAAAEALAACAPAATPTTAPPGAPTTAPPIEPTAPPAPPPTAEPSPPAPVAQPVGYPGFVWNPPYAALEFDYDKCNGCRICESACSVKNFGVLNPELSRIRIYDFYAGLVVVGSICWGCQWSGGSAAGGFDAFCLEACPTEPKAITWHPDLSIPVVDEDVCIRCGLCYDACPQHAIKESPLTNFPNVCTRCDGDPECAKQCPTGALQVRTSPSGNGYFYGRNTIEKLAEEIAAHRFYPWPGMEDWKKVMEV